MSTLRAFTMPKWGIEMTEGTLAEWTVSEGQRVAKGEVVAQVETDKIVNEIQSEFDIAFVRLIAKPGEIYPVGALLAVMAADAASAADIDAFVKGFRGPGDAPAEDAGGGAAAGAGGSASMQSGNATPGAAASATASGATASGAKASGGSAAASGPSGAAGASSRPSVDAPADGASTDRISPAASRLAAKLGVKIASVAGSGRRGRITYQDIEQASRPAREVRGGAPVSIEVKSAAPGDHRASPHARRLALEHGIDLAGVKATGTRGRISRRDVALAGGIALEPRSTAAAYETVRMSATRKAIARALTQAKTTIPHFYLRTQVNLDALMELRAEEKRRGAAPSVNDYVVRAAALALMQVPDVNVQYYGDEIRRFRHADIAVAVAAERGLITPILRGADGKSVQTVSAELRSLIERAHAGKLRAEDIEGGSFTISNLGMFGIDQFDAIINPPQGAILAVGAAARRPVERGGGLTIATTAHLSLSCDHRVIDGAMGARFLQALRETLEAPQRL